MSIDLGAVYIEISNKVINYLNTQTSFSRELVRVNVSCCIKIRNKVANSRRKDG